MAPFKRFFCHDTQLECVDVYTCSPGPRRFTGWLHRMLETGGFESVMTSLIFRAKSSAGAANKATWMDKIGCPAIGTRVLELASSHFDPTHRTAYRVYTRYVHVRQLRRARVAPRVARLPREPSVAIKSYWLHQGSAIDDDARPRGWQGDGPPGRTARGHHRRGRRLHPRRRPRGVLREPPVRQERRRRPDRVEARRLRRSPHAHRRTGADPRLRHGPHREGGEAHGQGPPVRHLRR